jgi:CheY-like chemotaxis protein
MTEPASILVVEDEPVVAKDIQLSLQRMGYKVPATATSGEEAIRKAGEVHPDLILMDIVLKGRMDGVETVRRIQHTQDVPVIYLTAYADDQTLDRAKETSPAGYMLKPYQPNELRTTIELALHRSHHDRHLRENLRWADQTMRCIGDGVVTTDLKGRVTYMNPAAEHLTGWALDAASGLSLTSLLGFQQEGPIQYVENPALHAMVDLRVITIGRPHGIINLCAWCKRVPDQAGEWYDLATFIAERSALQFNGGLCPDCMGRCFPESVREKKA